MDLVVCVDFEVVGIEGVVYGGGDCCFVVLCVCGWVVVVEDVVFVGLWIGVDVYYELDVVVCVLGGYWI